MPEFDPHDLQISAVRPPRPSQPELRRPATAGRLFAPKERDKRGCEGEVSEFDLQTAARPPRPSQPELRRPATAGRLFPSNGKAPAIVQGGMRNRPKTAATAAIMKRQEAAAAQIEAFARTQVMPLWIGPRDEAAQRRRESSLDLNPNHTLAMERERDGWRQEKDVHDRRRRKQQQQINELLREKKEVARRLQEKDQRITSLIEERDAYLEERDAALRGRAAAEAEAAELRAEVARLMGLLDTGGKRVRIRDSDLLRQCRAAELEIEMLRGRLRREAAEEEEEGGFTPLLTEKTLRRCEVVRSGAPNDAEAMPGEIWHRTYGAPDRLRYRRPRTEPTSSDRY
eukprot:Hpha_TRINITY_DN15393_c1_g7::TRINITY_DN15393_c1_g7_i1::g.87357::m.87357